MSEAVKRSEQCGHYFVVAEIEGTGKKRIRKTQIEKAFLHKVILEGYSNCAEIVPVITHTPLACAEGAVRSVVACDMFSRVVQYLCFECLLKTQWTTCKNHWYQQCFSLLPHMGNFKDFQSFLEF